VRELTDTEFDELITRAMDELPQEYITDMKNVAIVMQDEPSPEQREKLKLRDHTYLLGLYEGVPRPFQTGNEIALPPGKITLFKHHILAVVRDETSLFEQIKRTLWHEIAHYYGLNHDKIDELQQR
jgi:predicted Zn-dependent protease with MMP-like domain